ncbi:hypothetical protein MIMI-R681 [Acanthamoeba polyphaga mimivirus]|uniref:Uncharacterized protein n=1 Tax=Acanthamoeba polyphaga mimivirus TaxID=212035 RepID=E5L7Y9_MIMIV|nr:hypothetical protein MIMI_gp0602 [Acanthamoeba polyphaga mimivirus]ADQ48141.1 hypothetical protein [Acanthamoeba polyphaga mimivirus]UTE96774.1 hypothetical protein MIMI-R681 [Acanthamoeba polyphaga mimivirus]
MNLVMCMLLERKLILELNYHKIWFDVMMVEKIELILQLNQYKKESMSTTKILDPKCLPQKWDAKFLH